MSNDNDFGIGIVIGIAICLAAGGIIGNGVNKDIKKNHVSAGRATWVTLSDGSTEFQWIITEQKEGK